MSLYLFMGTHLPEMAECLTRLAKTEPGHAPTRIFIPEGLEMAISDVPHCGVSTYATGSNDWVKLEVAEYRNFVLLDPRGSPVPQLLTLAACLKARNLEPDKIVTCVDCAAVEENTALKAYYEACIYHSDDVLLGNRGSASKAFVRSFQKDFERRCFPSLFLLMKGNGYPSDPLEILTPGTRRIAQVFDLVLNQEDTNIPPIIEASCDLDLEEPEESPYLPGSDGSAPEIVVPDASPWIVPATGGKRPPSQVP